MLTLAQVVAQVARLTGQVRTVERRQARRAVVEATRTKRHAASIGPLVAGSIDVEVVWPVPFPDDLYVVLVEMATGAAGIGAVHAQLKVGTRTAEGCTITVVSTGNVAVAILDVLAVRP